MPLGWIDFSRSDRNRVLNVLELLSEQGTLDELGIAPIRDGFADIFFPGTSTLQTRAKYFFLVPYAMKEVEQSKKTETKQMLEQLDDLERECCGILLEKERGEDGIIGRRSYSQGGWLKRPPSSIYWAGLRAYGFFMGGSLSLRRYLEYLKSINQQRSDLGRLGNRNDGPPEESDDLDAGRSSQRQFWSIPTYQPAWKESLSVRLTREEGDFLKRQIVRRFPGSMMAYILDQGMASVLEAADFQELMGLKHLFPEKVQEDYVLAYQASEFIHILQTVYNLAISQEKNERAMEEWEKAVPHLKELAGIDLDQVYRRLRTGNVGLWSFLRKARQFMESGDLESLKSLICARERTLKLDRAKTIHPDKYDPHAWYGIDRLDYRYASARAIMRDIFESEGLYAESE